MLTMHGSSITCEAREGSCTGPVSLGLHGCMPAWVFTSLWVLLELDWPRGGIPHTLPQCTMLLYPP